MDYVVLGGKESRMQMLMMPSPQIIQMTIEMWFGNISMQLSFLVARHGESLLNTFLTESVNHM